MADLRLDFRAPKRGDIHFTPICQIRLGFHASDARGPLLTAECVSPQELAWWVRYLKADLDRMQAEAERKYARQDRAWRKRQEGRKPPPIPSPE